MNKADYGKIAKTYDAARKIRNEVLELWLDLIAKNSNLTNNSRFLDLGCGTGRFSIPIALRFKCCVVGADNSSEMLAKARLNDESKIVNWEQKDAEALDYPDNSFDAIFMSHLLHHVSSAESVVRNCCRVLKPGGLIFIRYGATEQILNDVEHVFFPETKEVDLARQISVGNAENWLNDAGFTNIDSIEVIQQTYSSIEDRYQSIKLKCTSALNLISKEAFESGLKRLKEYIDANADDPNMLIDKMTLTFGYKT